MVRLLFSAFRTFCLHPPPLFQDAHRFFLPSSSMVLLYKPGEGYSSNPHQTQPLPRSDKNTNHPYNKQHIPNPQIQTHPQHYFTLPRKQTSPPTPRICPPPSGGALLTFDHQNHYKPKQYPKLLQPTHVGGSPVMFPTPGGGGGAPFPPPIPSITNPTTKHSHTTTSRPPTQTSTKHHI